MRKFGYVLLGTALAALAIYGALKVSVHYRVKSDLDRFVAMAGPLAEIRYGSIQSSLSGTVTVENIVIRPKALPDNIRVGFVRLEGPDVRFLFDIAGMVDRAEPPERLTLSVGDLEMALEGAILSLLKPDNPPDARSYRGAGHKSCGLAGLFRRTQVWDLGLETVSMDANIGYQWDAAKGQMLMHLDYVVDGIESLALDLSLSDVPPPSAMALGVTPSLSAITVTYRPDRHYAGRAIENCAASQGQDVPSYVRSLVEADDETFSQSLGFIPGPGIRAALASYLENPGEIVMTVKPSSPLDPTVFATSSPEAVLSVLGLDLRVNGEEVGDLSFSLPAPPAEADQRPAPKEETRWMAGVAESFWGADAQDSERVSPEPSSQSSEYHPPRRRAPTFLHTDVARLDNHIGTQVRLFTDSRRSPREGVLVSVASGQAVVERRVHGGRMTFRVPLREISEARVWGVAEPN